MRTNRQQHRYYFILAVWTARKPLTASRAETLWSGPIKVFLLKPWQCYHRLMKIPSLNGKEEISEFQNASYFGGLRFQCRLSQILVDLMAHTIIKSYLFLFSFIHFHNRISFAPACDSSEAKAPRQRGPCFNPNNRRNYCSNSKDILAIVLNPPH